ncbi:sulfotransferase family 2 domain-containing protein [Campylobacter coli]|nr:sulfotransferase family 2 domain-containing protein [Campylobacter coli]
MFKDFHDKYKCIFIHVPKVAGSSIERVIYQTDKWLVGHVKASDYMNFDKDKFDSYFAFGFVRNPYDRVVSAYHYLKKGGGNKNDETWASKNIYKYSSFEEFVLALEDLEIQNKILNWMHFTPQYKFLCDSEKNILVNFVGKFENLEEDFKKILKILSRKDKLIHINKSLHANYKKYYNDAMYKIIRDIYRDDFEIFDYDLEDKKYFSISQYNYSKNLENKIAIKNTNLEFLRLDKLSKIQNLNQTIKTKNQTILDKNNLIQDQRTNIQNLNQTIQNNLTQIQILTQNIKFKEQIIQDKDNLLSFQTQYGAAKSRIKNQLSYKLGQTMIINSKNIFGILFMPVYIISTLLSHKQEQKIYQEKIKKDPSLKLPSLESYPDYKEAIKEKECLTYKLGEALIKANKTWYKGGYVKMWLEIRKLKKEFKKK